MRRKRYAASMEAVLEDRPGFRVRYELVPVRRLDRFEEERLLERVMRNRRREWLLSRCVCTGAMLGGLFGAWSGFRLYGPQGAVGGSIVGMILGGVLSVVLLILALIAVVGGAVYGVIWLVF